MSTTIKRYNIERTDVVERKNGPYIRLDEIAPLILLVAENPYYTNEHMDALQELARLAKSI